MSVLEQLKGAKWGKGWSVSWFAPPDFFLFFLLDLSNIENGRGLRVSLGSLHWGLESQFSLRIGMSAEGGAGFPR